MDKEISVDEILRGAADDHLTGGADINIDDILNEDYGLESNVVKSTSKFDFKPNLDITKSNTNFIHDDEIADVLKQAEQLYPNLEGEEYRNYTQPDIFINNLENDNYFKKKEDNTIKVPYKSIESINFSSY